MVPRRNLWRTLLHGRRDLGLRSPARRRAPADAGLLLRPVAAALPGLDRHHDARRHLRRRAAGPGTLRPRLRLHRRLPHTAGQPVEGKRTFYPWAAAALAAVAGHALLPGVW